MLVCTALGKLAVGALVAAGLLAFVISLRLISVGWAFVKLWGFRLTRSGEDLRSTYGLFTRRSVTVPRHRIQLVCK